LDVSNLSDEAVVADGAVVLVVGVRANGGAVGVVVFGATVAAGRTGNDGNGDAELVVVTKPVGVVKLFFEGGPVGDKARARDKDEETRGAE
jgi:hypothetical protein